MASLEGSFTGRPITRSFSTGQDVNVRNFLTPSTPAVANCGCLKGSAPYWFNPPFLIFDIQALWRSVLSARVPECQKSKMVKCKALTRSAVKGSKAV